MAAPTYAPHMLFRKLRIGKCAMGVEGAVGNRLTLRCSACFRKIPNDEESLFTLINSLLNNTIIASVEIDANTASAVSSRIDGLTHTQLIGFLRKITFNEQRHAGSIHLLSGSEDAMSRSAFMVHALRDAI